MPAESQAQRAFLYATKGAAWVKAHHFDNKGPLPARVATAKKILGRRRGKSAGSV